MGHDFRNHPRTESGWAQAETTKSTAILVHASSSARQKASFKIRMSILGRAKSAKAYLAIRYAERAVRNPAAGLHEESSLVAAGTERRRPPRPRVKRKDALREPALPLP